MTDITSADYTKLDLAVKLAQLCIPLFLGVLVWIDARVRGIERNLSSCQSNHAENGATKDDVARVEHAFERVHTRIDAVNVQLVNMPGEIVALMKGLK